MEVLIWILINIGIVNIVKTSKLFIFELLRKINLFNCPMCLGF